MKLILILIGCVLILSASLAFAGRESDEKGGTADINIGVGELQEASGETRGTIDGPKDLKNKEDEAEAGLLMPAVQSHATGGKKSKKRGNVETEFKVEKGEK